MFAGNPHMYKLVILIESAVEPDVLEAVWPEFLHTQS